ncbi:MAG: threonine synthase [Oscillospiraceae bacterium]|nr:threonine synthase [Oscillospiraceae bacterium]
MRYVSTRDASLKISAAEAIARGLSPDGGLFVPETLPHVSAEMLRSLGGMDYARRAAAIMALFLEDYTAEELKAFTEAAYSEERFGSEPAPLYKLDDATAYLELWHGPTCAFKDMALQVMPHLLRAALVKTGEQKQVCILVATSGDTGKAALEGFRDVAGTKIFVFYPSDGVSDVQKLQMRTQQGNNVGVCAVRGNFDDAQSGVKAIFGDETMRRKLAEAGYFFSSANSINWGRLLPQVVYYFSSYCDAVAQGMLPFGEPIDFCVPTGNFGDILAGWIAKKCGLPVDKLICASNTNKVLTDFFRTGTYDRMRPFHTTMSPSMDILISSNLERLLYMATGDDKQVKAWMTALSEKGSYSIPADLLKSLQEDFAFGWCSEENTAAEIGKRYSEGYLMDTHTAVASRVLADYRAESGDRKAAVVLSTASPYKFCDHVLRAIGAGTEGSGTQLIETLSKTTGTAVPGPLDGLDKREVRFDQVVEKNEMPAAVLGMLGII